MSEMSGRYLSEEARGGFWAKNINVGVNSTSVVLKAKRVDEGER